MPANTVAQLLAFANLQMAAEARLDLFANQASEPGLIFGNNRSGKFTPTQATQFAAEWTVVEHKPNTATGFSGTLFEYTGETDAVRGLTRGQLVMSLRSTEFIDDAVRDSQATGAMEIREYGWAFGQIDDMRQWYESLNIPPTANLTVTGYSLGGHLATAFSLLYPGAARATYTFNGAGVGVTKNNVSLTTTINNFNQMRSVSADQSVLFTDAEVRSMYASLRTELQGGALVTDTQLFAARTLAQAKNGPNVPQTWGAEALMLLNALNRIRTIQAEAARIVTPQPFDSGSSQSGSLVPVGASLVEATNLNYQLAVLRAGQNTSSYRTFGPLSGWDAITNRNPWPGGAIPGFYDVFGANLPSGVSNSQYHYGTATPIFIENQPLVRGIWPLETLSASWTALLGGQSDDRPWDDLGPANPFEFDFAMPSRRRLAANDSIFACRAAA